MNKAIQEKRYSKRIFFAPETGISGNFLFPSVMETPQTATLMDLSLLGIGITMIKESFPPVERGNPITLCSINSFKGLAFMKNIELEIRWVLKHSSLEHVALGCEFIHLPPAVEEQISRFITRWIIQ